jgi:hypothetical protein
MRIVRKPLLLVLGLAATAVAVLRRRKAAADAELWREATSDSSR